MWEAITDALTEAKRLEERSTRLLVGAMNAADATVADAVAAAGDALAGSIDAIVERLARGGRLVYVGAGTSGAIGALDAVEIPPTFGAAPGDAIALTAGDSADVEDDDALGRELVRNAGVGPGDAVVGISASGATPFPLAALAEARERGALTVAVTCALGSALARRRRSRGGGRRQPEIVSGSTRLKAGTAQKMIANAISTVAMVRLGRTYDGLMVGVAPQNAKLRDRARRNVVLASGAPEHRRRGPRGRGRRRTRRARGAARRHRRNRGALAARGGIGLRERRARGGRRIGR